MSGKRKFVFKQQNKQKGVVHQILERNFKNSKDTFILLVIRKGNKKGGFICFTAYEEIRDAIKNNFKVGDRIKVKYAPQSSWYEKYQNWITKLIATDVSEWSNADTKHQLSEDKFNAEKKQKELFPNNENENNRETTPESN